MFNTENLTKKIPNLSKRIVDISYRHKVGHIGSCLTALPVICEIYESMGRPDDIFILSSGHSALALYVVLEEVYGHDAEKLFNDHGVHPHRDVERHIYCSTGSLGQGITVAVGYALADRNRHIFVLISDGESFEGSVWESLIYIYQNWLRMHVYVNMNGYSAISKIHSEHIKRSLCQLYPLIHIRETGISEYEPILSGLEAHYKVLNKEEYESLLEMIR